MNKICIVCGNSFETKGGFSVCCSKSCDNEFKINFDSYPLYCVFCKKRLTYKQVRKGHKHCSVSCASKDSSIKNDYSSKIKEKWKDGDFRDKVIHRMKTNNPFFNKETVKKMKETKENNGTLHVFTNRGGNGKVSKCESLLMDFCIANNFEYNKAINTYSVRVANPEKHYAFNYKPDFVNFDLKLCIEIDGESHRRNKHLDRKKEDCLATLGYKTIRFTNKIVLENLTFVMETILKEMEELESGKTSVQRDCTI